MSVCVCVCVCVHMRVLRINSSYMFDIVETSSVRPKKGGVVTQMRELSLAGPSTHSTTRTGQ